MIGSSSLSVSSRGEFIQRVSNDIPMISDVENTTLIVSRYGQSICAKSLPVSVQCANGSTMEGRTEV